MATGDDEVRLLRHRLRCIKIACTIHVPGGGLMALIPPTLTQLRLYLSLKPEHLPPQAPDQEKGAALMGVGLAAGPTQVRNYRLQHWLHHWLRDAIAPLAVAMLCIAIYVSCMAPCVAHASYELMVAP